MVLMALCAVKRPNTFNSDKGLAPRFQR